MHKKKVPFDTEDNDGQGHLAKTTPRSYELHHDTGSVNSLTRNILELSHEEHIDYEQLPTEKKEPPVEVSSSTKLRRRKMQTQPSEQVPRMMKTEEARLYLFELESEPSQAKASTQLANKSVEVSSTDAQRRFVKKKQRRKVEYESNFKTTELNFSDDDRQEKRQPLPTEQKTHTKIVTEPSQPYGSKQVNDEEEQEDVQAQVVSEQTPRKLMSLELDSAPILIRMSGIKNMKTFLTSTVPKGQLLQCTIRRQKSGLDIFRPRYDLHLSEECSLLMSAKKKGGTSANYYFSLSKEEFEDPSPNYLGRVKGNFTGSFFTLLDEGCNPDKAPQGKLKRRVIGSVHFQTNLFGAKAPRRIKAYIPNPVLDKIAIEGEKDLKEYFEGPNRDFFCELTNRAPRWNSTLKVYALNFRGRVDKPSVKNFILEDLTLGENTREALLFGRVGDDTFNMDVAYPLSPLLAFQIVITSFDYKIACE